MTVPSRLHGLEQLRATSQANAPGAMEFKAPEDLAAPADAGSKRVSSNDDAAAVQRSFRHAERGHRRAHGPCALLHRRRRWQSWPSRGARYPGFRMYPTDQDARHPEFGRIYTAGLGEAMAGIPGHRLRKCSGQPTSDQVADGSAQMSFHHRKKAQRRPGLGSSSTRVQCRSPGP